MMDHRAVGQVQVSWSNPVGAPKKKNMHEYHLPEDKPLALYHLIWEKLTINHFFLCPIGDVCEGQALG